MLILKLKTASLSFSRNLKLKRAKSKANLIDESSDGTLGGKRATHGVPHIAPLADDRTTHREKVINDAASILGKFGIEPTEDYLLLWSYILRHLIYFAAYVLNDPRTDTKENRYRNEMIMISMKA